MILIKSQKNIVTSLTKVINTADSYLCITANYIISTDDEVAIVLKELSDYIFKEFSSRSYRIKVIYGGGLKCIGMNFKKKH